ncbi:MAG: DUF1631 domain-containing protein, partial [Thiohalocapsa sp.]|nr:DUF1631 domain-containing protein [Thiohalocapsa sp.]
LWHPFLRALMPLHMAAIKPPTETPREPGSGQPLVEPADSRADNGEPAPPGDSDHGQGSDEFDVSARKLAVGDWAEFADVDGAQMTLCASWISDVSGLILFADRQAQNPLVLTRVQFARHLRNGNARLLSRDPLTDRAVAQLLVYATPDGPSQD